MMNQNSPDMTPPWTKGMTAAEKDKIIDLVTLGTNQQLVDEIAKNHLKYLKIRMPEMVKKKVEEKFGNNLTGLDEFKNP